MNRLIPRKVVLVSEPTGGGVGKHVLDLAERLPSHGFEVLLVHATSRPEHDFMERLARHRDFGYQVAPFNVTRAPGLKDIPGTITLRRAIRDFGGADILHGHSSKAGALSRLGRWRVARRVLYTPNAFYTQSPHLGRLEHKVFGFIEYGLSKLADRIIVVSREEYEHAQQLGIAPEKLVLIENGIVLRSTDEIERARMTMRTSLGIGPSEIVVGFLGRLAPQKAPQVAVEVFRRLLDAHPSIRPVMVGDGPDADAVRALIQQLGLQNTVRHIPAAIGRDVIPIFDIFLLTSRYEGFPYVLLEALESSCAIVSTRVGGAVDCVQEGINGYIVDTADPDLLANRVLRLCQDPSLLYRMRTSSRTHSAQFSVDRMVDRIVDLYRSFDGFAQSSKHPSSASRA